MLSVGQITFFRRASRTTPRSNLPIKAKSPTLQAQCRQGAPCCESVLDENGGASAALKSVRLCRHSIAAKSGSTDGPSKLVSPALRFMLFVDVSYFAGGEALIEQIDLLQH